MSNNWDESAVTVDADVTVDAVDAVEVVEAVEMNESKVNVAVEAEDDDVFEEPKKTAPSYQSG